MGRNAMADGGDRLPETAAMTATHLLAAPIGLATETTICRFPAAQEEAQ